jgi:hypothetical protein
MVLEQKTLFPFLLLKFIEMREDPYLEKKLIRPKELEKYKKYIFSSIVNARFYYGAEEPDIVYCFNNNAQKLSKNINLHELIRLATKDLYPDYFYRIEQVTGQKQR